MIKDLESYTPIGNQVLLKVSVKTHSEGGLELGAIKVDRWMEVVKLGYLVDSNVINLGDVALIGELMSGAVNMTFGDDKYMQVSLHDVVGVIKRKSVVDPKLN